MTKNQLDTFVDRPVRCEFEATSTSQPQRTTDSTGGNAAFREAMNGNSGPFATLEREGRLAGIRCGCEPIIDALRKQTFNLDRTAELRTTYKGGFLTFAATKMNGGCADGNRLDTVFLNWIIQLRTYAKTTPD